MLCRICQQEMDNRPVTVDHWVCRNAHGGQPPKIGAATLACPVAKGAIWVHVVDDGGANLVGIPVTVDGKEKKTKAGFASWDPLEAPAYTVTLGEIPKEYLPLAMPTLPNVPVHKGEITSVQYTLERACRLTVIVRLAEAEESLADMEVAYQDDALGATGKAPTKAGAGALFEKLHKGEHTVTLTLTEEQKKLYWIDGEPSQAKDVLPEDPNRLLFTLRPIVKLNVTFHVQLVGPGGTTELTGATVKLKDLGLSQVSSLLEAMALAKFVIEHASREPKESVEVTSLSPDGSDDIYEVIGVTTA